ncbi:MAG: M1 family aminopeptidase [Ignavibacteriaceae bacterium]
MKVKIDVPSKKVFIDGFINADFKNSDTLNLVLWKYSSIKEINNKDKNIKYHFDTLTSSPIMYIPNGRKLLVVKSNNDSSRQSLYFNYSCDFTTLSGWANSFAENWIELNFYCAWFPVNLGKSNFSSKFSIYINDGYSITGSGIVSKKRDCWEMSQPWGSFDNVIIASRSLQLKSLEKNSLHIEADYSSEDFPETDSDSVLTECKNVLNLFEEIFGKRDSTYLKFVIAPFEMGGYSRRNFVCLRTKKFNLYTEKGIAHEIAHFWWHNASSTTWEDWLNEAFAEYSMLVYIREKKGDKIFQKIVEEYKNKTKDLPSIQGIDRNSPKAYSVLYEKGPLILYEFEELVGKDLFFNFLKEAAKSKIATTSDLLNLTEKLLSKEVRSWLEIKLKT